VAGSGYAAPQDPAAALPAGAGPTTYGTTYGAAPGASTYGGTTYGGATYGSTTYGAPGAELAASPPVSDLPGRYGAPAAIGPAESSQTVRTDPPASDRKATRPGRRGRPDPCAALRSACEQLRVLAAAAAAAATQAATDAESAHADFVSAQRSADEARRALEEVVREVTEVANQVADLDRAPTDGQEQLQAETSHAAFAAYRRGDISAEQLREVFKRAEGWTPEHDRLSRLSNELRARETELIRTRDAAILAEQLAGDRARTAAIAARNLDVEARTAAVDARGRCAAAEACEQRNRRR
jgi:hypothetical protein